MSMFKDILDYLTKIFQWWVTVQPWETGLRIRAGKKVKNCGPGIHLRIPFLDNFYSQTDRLRVIQMAPQTITTKDGHTITVTMAPGYSIMDIEKLYTKMCQPEMTISNIVMGEVADFVANSDLGDCSPLAIELQVMNRLKNQDYGIRYEYVKCVGYAVVKAFRLIQDGHWVSNGLSTSEKR